MPTEWLKGYGLEIEADATRYCLDLGNYPIDIVGSDEQGWEVFIDGFLTDKFKSVQEAKAYVKIELEKLAELSELKAKEIREFLVRSESHITLPKTRESALQLVEALKEGVQES
jgi:ERCC4-type nuclease